MKLAIIHSVSGKSAKLLKEYLEYYGHTVTIDKPAKSGRLDFTEFDWVFSLGCSAYIANKPNRRINSAGATICCINKINTFDLLKLANIPTLEYCTTRHNIPDHWDQVCARKDPAGRKAEGLEWFTRDRFHEISDEYTLFTRCFYGNYEYRIMVFKGEVVARYYKRLDEDGMHWFVEQPASGFEKMDESCKKAAKALGIDYVGFDVIAKNKRSYAILEANSGALIEPSTAEAICKWFNKGEFK